MHLRSGQDTTLPHSIPQPVRRSKRLAVRKALSAVSKTLSNVRQSSTRAARVVKSAVTKVKAKASRTGAKSKRTTKSPRSNGLARKSTTARIAKRKTAKAMTTMTANNTVDATDDAINDTNNECTIDTDDFEITIYPEPTEPTIADLPDLSLLLNLPPELWLQILEHLPYTTLKTLRYLSRRFHELTSSAAVDSTLFRNVPILDSPGKAVEIHPILDLFCDYLELATVVCNCNISGTSLGCPLSQRGTGVGGSGVEHIHDSRHSPIAIDLFSINDTIRATADEYLTSPAIPKMTIIDREGDLIATLHEESGITVHAFLQTVARAWEFTLVEGDENESVSSFGGGQLKSTGWSLRERDVRVLHQRAFASGVATGDYEDEDGVDEGVDEHRKNWRLVLELHLL